MQKPELRVSRDLEELSREGAAEFRELARGAVSEKGLFASALSGGTTPRRLYELLAEPATEVRWPGVHLFQVDERSVAFSGEDKARTLRAVLEGPFEVELLPAQGIQPAQGRVSWFADRPAAKLLSRLAGSTS